MNQLEMPFLGQLKQAKYVEEEVVFSFCTFRDAVVWAWENRTRGKGMTEQADQSCFCYNSGYIPSHFSRAVNPHTKSPMELKPDFVASFDAYVGNRAVTQYLNKITYSTSFEEIQARRAA